MNIKRFLLLVLIIIIVCAFPLTACANPAYPVEWTHELLVDGCNNINIIAIYGYDKDNKKIFINEYSLMDDEYYYEDIWLKKTSTPNERSIGFTDYTGKLIGIQIEIEFIDGKVQKSEIVELSNYKNYFYDVEKNNLKSKLFNNADFYKQKIIPLLFACGLALLIEGFVAIIFRIKPVKYVLIVNLISNPLMNVILIL